MSRPASSTNDIVHGSDEVSIRRNRRCTMVIRLASVDEQREMLRAQCLGSTPSRRSLCGLNTSNRPSELSLSALARQSSSLLAPTAACSPLHRFMSLGSHRDPSTWTSCQARRSNSFLSMRAPGCCSPATNDPPLSDPSVSPATSRPFTVEACECGGLRASSSSRSSSSRSFAPSRTTKSPSRQSTNSTSLPTISNSTPTSSSSPSPSSSLRPIRR